jgi:hypothetical protein
MKIKQFIIISSILQHHSSTSISLSAFTAIPPDLIPTDSLNVEYIEGLELP